MAENTCYVIIYIAIGLVLLGLQVWSYIEIKSVSSTYTKLTAASYLYDNWNKIPISDLKIVSMSSACPDGFSLLDLGNLPYFDSGCINEDYSQPVFESFQSTYDDNSFGIEQCSMNKGRQKGKIVGIGSKISLSTWRNSKICVKYSQYDYFTNMATQREIATCKKCKGLLDSNEETNEFCVPADTDCPINYISIVDTSKYIIPKGMRVEKFNDDSNLSLVFTSNVENYNFPGYKAKILVDLKITLGFPCYLPFEVRKSSDESSFYFVDKDGYNNCAFNSTYNNNTINYNPNIVPLDTDFQINLYKYTNTLGYYAGGIPNYPTQNLFKNDYVLSYNNYYGLKSKGKSVDISKLTSFKSQEIIYKNNGEDSNWTSYNYPNNKANELLISIIITLSFISFTILHFVWIIDKDSCLAFFAYMNFLILLGLLGTYIANIVISFQGYSATEYFGRYNEINNLFSSDSFDSYTSNINSILYKDYINTSSSFLISGISNIVSIVLLVVYFVFSVVMIPSDF